MNKKLLLLFISLLFSCAVFAATPVITNNNKPIIVSKAQPTFVIKLTSNPSTGYSWLLSHYYPFTLIRPISREYVAPKKMMPGASGYELWTFKVTKAGFKVPQIIFVQLVYARNWEITKGQAKTFEVVTHDN